MRTEAAQKVKEDAALKAGEEARHLAEELWNEETRREAVALTLTLTDREKEED